MNVDITDIFVDTGETTVLTEIKLIAEISLNKIKDDRDFLVTIMQEG